MVRQRVYDHNKKKKKEKSSNFFHRPNSTGLTNEKKKASLLSYFSLHFTKVNIQFQGKARLAEVFTFLSLEKEFQ